MRGGFFVGGKGVGGFYMRWDGRKRLLPWSKFSAGGQSMQEPAVKRKKTPKK